MTSFDDVGVKVVDLGVCTLCGERDAVWSYSDESGGCCDECLSRAIAAVQTRWPILLGEAFRSLHPRPMFFFDKQKLYEAACRIEDP